MKPVASWLACLLGAAALAGCQTRTTAPNAATMDVAFEWTAGDRCASSSPAFTIAGVPAGTAALEFEMTDLDVPSYDHGGGTVTYSGSDAIPAGAFSYRGPCPPGGSHDYRFDVLAVGADGTVLGRGSATRPFP